MRKRFLGVAFLVGGLAACAVGRAIDAPDDPENDGGSIGPGGSGPRIDGGHGGGTGEDDAGGGGTGGTDAGTHDAGADADSGAPHDAGEDDASSGDASDSVDDSGSDAAVGADDGGNADGGAGGPGQDAGIGGSGGSDGGSETGADGGEGGTDPVCSNHIVETGEACDDGNLASGDGCSAQCQWETNCGTNNARQVLECGGAKRTGSFYGAFNDLKASPICGKSYPNYVQDKLFVFKAPADLTATVRHTTSPNQNDTAMFVLRGSCHSGLCIADSISQGDHRTVTFHAEAGVTYFIELKAPSNQPNFEIWLTCEMDP